MNRRKNKVEETAASYAAKPPAKAAVAAPKPVEPGVRLADLAAVRRSNAKLLQVHRKVLQKLAQ